MSKPTVNVTYSGVTHPVWIGSGLIDRLGHLIGSRESAGRCVVITDRVVVNHYGQRTQSALTAAGWQVHTLTWPVGERTKSAKSVRELQESLFAMNADRTTVVVALGGGVVGDTAGFAAATFMRGLPLYHVPTTIIAQVDSSIGGKVGINNNHGKNLLGVFYQPRGVVVDPDLLQTLPEREFASGLAEIVKYGIIRDRELFENCESNLKKWIASRSVPSGLVKQCIAIKVDVVTRDERESGLRRILNFGHTAGHAIERWGDYRRFRHGEAVALGMIIAATMAYRRQSLPNKSFERILYAVKPLLPKRLIPSLDQATEIARLTFHDKKRRGGRSVWVLPKRIGRIGIAEDVKEREIVDAIRDGLKLAHESKQD